MPRAAFRCARCNRTFSMAAHLARHNSAVHGTRGRKRGGPRKAGRRGRRPGRPRGGARTAAASAPAGESRGEVLSTMSAYRDQLVAQRESIDAELAGIDNAMSALGSGLGSMTVPARTRARRGRPKGSGGGRSGTLKDSVVRVLRQRGTPMSPGEIADAVKKAGYKTKASNLTKAVSNALPDIGPVKKVGRGQYRI